jgi:hypothetical protein
MTWPNVKKTLTTRPSPRPPLPKAPLFTMDPFSTKSFGPGHIIGAGILALGLFGLTKFFISRGQAEAARTLRLAETPRPPRRPDDAEPKLARPQNARGQYGKTQ